jgi:hypothetical protein
MENLAPSAGKTLKKIKQKFLKQHHQNAFVEFTEHSGLHG